MTNKKSYQREKIRQRQKKRKIIFLIILLMTIVIAFCIYLLTAETFQIQRIEVEGNNQLTQEQICELSGIKIGDNIFSTLEIVTRVKLKQNGYIEDVTLEKTYPNSVKIKITERQIQYQILTETGCYIYIDEQGHIINYSLDNLGIFTITGMQIDENNIEGVSRLGEEDLQRMENVLQIREEAKKIGINDQIQQIDTKEEYIIHLSENKIIINLGDATNLKNRMLYVEAILKEESGKAGTIYVNGNLNDGFAPYFNENI